MNVKKLFFFFVNVYVIKAGDKTILFDCGAILEPEKLEGFAREQGVSPEDIDLIIVSHDHFDHMMLLEVADTFYGGHGDTYARNEVENLLES